MPGIYSGRCWGFLDKEDVDAMTRFKEIEKNKQRLIQLSLDIWKNPEGPYEEHLASNKLAEFLEKEGFTVERKTGGIETAIKASYGKGSPVIGFLGEYDALPGLSQKAADARNPIDGQTYGHGCGHNLIAAANVGAVLELKAQLECGKLKGTVVYFGCPAEEVLTGKGVMAEAGVFDCLDAAVSFHPMEANMTTTGNMQACNSVKFHFKGISAHAGSNPQDGRSALDAVELMDIGANYLREHVDEDVKFHYMITECGNLPNIVPESACVWYYIRASRRELVEEIHKRLVKIAQGAALMTETEMKVEFLGGCYETLNNAVLAEVIYKSMIEIAQEPWSKEEIAFAAKLNAHTPRLKQQMIEEYGLPQDTEIFSGVLPVQEAAVKSSTDVGDVAHIVPTIFFTTACNNIGAAGHSWQITSCSGSKIGQKGMLYAARIMAEFGRKLLENPAIVERAAEEFKEQMGGRVYKCPIPDDVIQKIKERKQICQR